VGRGAEERHAEGRSITVRFATYNIRHSQGISGTIFTSRIAAVLAAIRADVVGLNEVWRFGWRPDQASQVAHVLGDEHVYAEAHVRFGIGLGNAVLTRGEVVESAVIELGGKQERRVCALMTTDVRGVRMRFASTHLSLDAPTRATQIALLARELPTDLPLVLAGDFNAKVAELEPLRSMLTVVKDSPPTFMAPFPTAAIDHIAFSQQWRLEGLATVRSSASDHLPLVAELELR
jgi:endonuclease/exonuclease/phosphatase family metal-dependent hydrolase